MIKNYLVLCIGVSLCACRSIHTKHICHDSYKYQNLYDDQNPYDIAQKIQGVYELIPYENASNPRVIVLSPIIRSTDDASYTILIDAVLIERGEFFDKAAVRQWTALFYYKDKTIHYPDGRLYGRFLNDNFNKLWIHDYSSDTDNENSWESYYIRKK